MYMIFCGQSQRDRVHLICLGLGQSSTTQHLKLEYKPVVQLMQFPQGLPLVSSSIGMSV